MTDDTLRDLLIPNLKARGSKPAIACPVDGAVSYSDLVARSDELASLLIEIGAEPGDRIMIICERNARFPIAMFAASKVGCIFVPCSVKDPAKHLMKLVDLCDPIAILCDERGFEKSLAILAEHRQTSRIKMTRDGNFEVLPAKGTRRIAAPSVSRPVAEIIFTSGSQRAPKGVMISHRAIIDYANWAKEYFVIQPGDRVGSTAPFSFDMATFDIFATLAAGATLCPLKEGEAMFPELVSKWLVEESISVWKGAASLVALLARRETIKRPLPDLRVLAFSGEVLNLAPLRTWMRAVPHCRYFNAYGPTEATGVTLVHEVKEVPNKDELAIPIGRPRDGVIASVRDDGMRPICDGDEGELCLAGASLAEGYWQDAMATRQAFASEATSLDAAPTTIYRTGDIAVLDQDGTFWFRGRRDDEAKVRGYRVNIELIVHELRQTPGVIEAAVTTLMDERLAATVIVAFVILEPKAALAEIRSALAVTLPDYMCPRYFFPVGSLSYNERGKIDRSELARIFQEKVQSPQASRT